MTILRDISFLWSMLHIIILLLLVFEPRYSWRTTLAAGCSGWAAMLAVNVLIMAWKGPGIIMSIAFFSCTIPSLLLFFTLSRYRDGRFFFVFCLSDTVCFWLLQVTNFLDRLTGDTYVVMLIGRLIVFPVVEILFWRYLRRPYLELQSKLGRGWWLFAAIGATYYLLIMVTSVPVGSPMPDTIGLIRIILVLILMPLTYMTILHSLWRQIQVHESSRQAQLQRQEYERTMQKMELGRIYRHDMRHHLLVLEGMLQQGDSVSAQRYIGELSGKLVELNQTAWCANTAVNAALTAYITEATQAGCRIDAEVHLPAELPYGEMDLCIILSNALENAINACKKSPPAERDIQLRLILTDNHRIALTLENSCPDPVRFSRDGLPVSSGREEHGLGLHSIRSTAERYGGMFRCGWEAGRFSLQVVMFPPEKEKGCMT